jgi:hypothetical protein
MRCDLYSTGTDSRIISCTVLHGFAQRASEHGICKCAADSPPHGPLLHRHDPSHVQRFLRMANLFKNPFERGSRMSTEAFLNRAAIATAFGMLIVLVC